MQLQLEEERIFDCLQQLKESAYVIRDTPRPTPLAFPLLVDQLRDRLSSETLVERVTRMQQDLETFAGRSEKAR